MKDGQIVREESPGRCAGMNELFGLSMTYIMIALLVILGVALVQHRLGDRRATA